MLSIEFSFWNNIQGHRILKQTRPEKRLEKLVLASTSYYRALKEEDIQFCMLVAEVNKKSAILGTWSEDYILTFIFNIGYKVQQIKTIK